MLQFNFTYMIPSYFLKMLCLMNVFAYIYGHDICQYPLHTLFMTQIFAYKDKLSIFLG
jgi:hypothetical protein